MNWCIDILCAIESVNSEVNFGWLVHFALVTVNITTPITTPKHISNVVAYKHLLAHFIST